MRTAILVTTFTVIAAALPGCFFWHTEHEHDRDDYRTSSRSDRTCGNEICARDQTCVSAADGTFHCQ